MSKLVRVLTFVLFYVLGSKCMALLGIGPTVQLLAGLVAGFLAAVLIGDMLANNRRKNAPGAAKQGKWDR
jgi:hypothetical protein